MQLHKKWLRYWKNSLADAQRISFDLSQMTHLSFESIDIAEGVLPPESIYQLFEKEEKKINNENGITDRYHKNWKELHELNVIISIFTMNPKPEYLQFTATKKSIRPFWIPALLQKTGELKIADNHFPYIPRDYLSPAGNEEYDFIFASVDNIDKAFAFKLDEIRTWNNYWQYIEEIFVQITEVSFENYKEEFYHRKKEQIIVVQDEEKNAAYAIIELYQQLLKSDKLPQLLQRFISLETPKDQLPMPAQKYMAFHERHLGQMGDAFPLSITQRKSIYTFFDSEAHTVFAVNGPPGTGKTTLLQSVVANHIVLSAIEGKEAPLILACSTNNQAVTNINESFSKTDSKLDKLKDRWIPNFSGYATYLPSKSKTDQELKGINFIKVDTKGTFETLENQNYVTKAGDYFLEKANNFLNKNYASVPEVTDALQSHIKNIQTEIQAANRCWTELNDKIKNIGTMLDPKKIDDGMMQKLSFWYDLKKQIQEVENNVSTYFNKEPLLRKLL